MPDDIALLGLFPLVDVLPLIIGLFDSEVCAGGRFVGFRFALRQPTGKHECSAFRHFLHTQHLQYQNTPPRGRRCAFLAYAGHGEFMLNNKPANMRFAHLTRPNKVNNLVQE
ncbi:MAG: hypothetical protein JKY01_12695 [Pseudomonadales bacterium]|nr:hypothetical protein [Pseudomonadales bacterium]